MTPTPELVALQYRKRPVVIEAVQLTNEVASVCLRDRVPGPFGLTVFGSWNQKSGIVYSAHITIQTLEGDMRADLGDWIIRGVKGELYPCKPDIFAATYEPATRAAALPQGVVDQDALGGMFPGLQSDLAKLTTGAAGADPIREALAEVIRAARAYLPPDGISPQDCISRVLAATDNARINAAMGEIE